MVVQHKLVSVLFLCLLASASFASNLYGQSRYTIAVAEIMQETNSFSSVLTTREDFEAGVLAYGPEILDIAKQADLEIGGFLEAVDDIGDNEIVVVPIIKARSMAGGPVKSE